MNKPQGFDETEVFTDYKKLPKGGYICRIVKLEETVSKNGNDMIAVYLDIADGEFKDYYREKYQNDTRIDRKWGCIYRQVVLDSTTGQTNKGFKGFITSVEESNSGFVTAKIWGNDFTKHFKDKYVGCIFIDEHYTDQDGKPRTIAKPNRICSIQKIKSGDFKIPDDKYQDKPATTGWSPDFTENSSAADDDCPF